MEPEKEHFISQILESLCLYLEPWCFPLGAAVGVLGTLIFGPNHRRRLKVMEKDLSGIKGELKVLRDVKPSNTITITVGDIYIGTDRQNIDLPSDAILAKHSFFQKMLYVGTKAGTVKIRLESQILNNQIVITDSILVAMSKNNILAPLSEGDIKAAGEMPKSNK